MSDRYIKAHHLDASAAVKLVLREPGSVNLRTYFDRESGFYMTSLCIAEALGVLKRKMCKGDLSREQYFANCYILLDYLNASRIRVDEIDLSDLDTFVKAERMARQHKLDLSDSLQLVSVKHGKFFSAFVGESKTLIITADHDLASAAKAEDLRVWNCEKEQTPPAQ